jgi:hypothetical protein
MMDAEPIYTVVTTTIQPEEPVDPEEGKRIFHSQMWVKGTSFHLIVDNDRKKNLISTKAVEYMGLSKTPHP